MPKRIVGLDAARAVALIAMMAAHLTYTGSLTQGIAGQLLYGFPSALFAVLAGMSMTLMRASWPQFAARGLFLIALHFALVPLAGEIEVVLLQFGICMIGLGWVTQWSSGLLAALCVLLTAASAVMYQYEIVPLELLGPPYPLAMWAALMVAGMLVRLHLHNYRMGAIGGGLLAAGDMAARYYYLPHEGFEWLEANGHTGGVLDIVGSVGMAVAVYSVCCLLKPSFLQPLGSMPLTIYCLHILTATFLNFLASAAVAFFFAAVWKHFFQRGPLEQLTKEITERTKTSNEEARSITADRQPA